MEISRQLFGPDFQWGTSTAAYQIEGAHNLHGKGPSIWDEFVQARGKIRNRHTGNMACDFYHRYPSDLELMQKLSIPNHRFSLSWSRIIPEGTGRINRKGIEFYDRLIDHTLERGITPWVTLYHWDLPLSLQNDGGWTNRNIVDWFGNYVSICVKHFGDRVKHWMILNEPMVFSGAGYFLGVHAPGKRGLKSFLKAVHHAALCQAEGGRVVRSLNGNSIIGTTFSCTHVEPYRDTEKDHLSTRRVDALLNRTFIEPLLGMGYPAQRLPLLKMMEQVMKPGDEERLAFNMDFIGLQCYAREIIRTNWFMPYVKAGIVKASKRKVPHTLMDWEIYPRSIYEMISQFASYPNAPTIIVTENGAAFRDYKVNKNIDDLKRVHYLQQHIGEVFKARKEGKNVSGYFIWTFLDNFEWAEGFEPTFGLVHVNFQTQERVIKRSGYWYRDFLRNEPFHLKDFI